MKALSTIAFFVLTIFSGFSQEHNRAFIVNGSLSGGAYSINGKVPVGMLGVGAEIQSQWFKDIHPNAGPGLQVTWLGVEALKYDGELGYRGLAISPLQIGPAYQWHFENENSLSLSFNVGYTLYADAWGYGPDEFDAYNNLSLSPQLQLKLRRTIVGISYLFSTGNADRSADQIETHTARLHIGIRN